MKIEMHDETKHNYQHDARRDVVYGYA